ncbi:helix-hairpin-helix domain-containing protein [Natranaeroarchaeum sulfidigenes]|uniref:helix-hairpin-helix domain-containing protein n=1 Tax=Natranaeroarchaeum sulfidigenes TaxID=2784880 RepID=UPI001EE523F0|nr:helix-hairpin-helix domain-containing protein [Natranaeroarchaeum sulfidigenes]
MSLLDKLKSLLGLDSTDERQRQDVGVTVERDVGGDDPDANAVDTGGAADVEADEDTAEEDTDEEPDDATGEPEEEINAEDESVDEDELIDEAEPDDEEDVAEDTESEDVVQEGHDPEDDADVAADDGEDANEDDDETTEDPTTEKGELEDIKGIGPAYAERLADVGVESIADLAAADPSAIAAESDLAESRVENWVEQAKVR